MTVLLSRWRKLERRAVTLKLKAEALQHELMCEVGADDYATTVGDNLVIAADDMLEHLERRVKGQPA